MYDYEKDGERDGNYHCPEDEACDFLRAWLFCFFSSLKCVDAGFAFSPDPDPDPRSVSHPPSQSGLQNAESPPC